MNWQGKLEILINLSVQGHPLLKRGFNYTQSLSKEQIENLILFSALSIPASLRDFFTFADGAIFGLGLRICGLQNEKLEQNLFMINIEFLETARQFYPTAGIDLIIGSDGGTGDLLCITNKGVISSIHFGVLSSAEYISDSLDAFFNEICMGSGYISHYNLTEITQEGDVWVPLLRELGFI